MLYKEADQQKKKVLKELRIICEIMPNKRKMRRKKDLYILISLRKDSSHDLLLFLRMLLKFKSGPKKFMRVHLLLLLFLIVLIL